MEKTTSSACGEKAESWVTSTCIWVYHIAGDLGHLARRPREIFEMF
jgi:hypothetical protein